MMLPIREPDARGNVRTFTLSSSPTEDMIMITTKQGRSSFKRALFGFRKGDGIEVRGPVGSFTFQKDSPGPYVFIAGGIGITPFRSMIKYALDKKLPQRITLLYCARTQEEFVFRKELDEWKDRHPPLSILYTVTHPIPGLPPWDGRIGRIDESWIRDHAKDERATRYYVCGSGGMVDEMTALLTRMKIPSQAMHFEKFSGYISD
jgi:ferredoxin-NADP reductase